MVLVGVESGADLLEPPDYSSSFSDTQSRIITLLQDENRYLAWHERLGNRHYYD